MADGYGAIPADTEFAHPEHVGAPAVSLLREGLK